MSNLENQICLDRNEFRLWLSQICRDTYFDVEVQAFNSDLNHGSLYQNNLSWLSHYRPLLRVEESESETDRPERPFSADFEVSQKLKI